MPPRRPGGAQRTVQTAGYLGASTAQPPTQGTSSSSQPGRVRIAVPPIVPCTRTASIVVRQSRVALSVSLLNAVESELP
jgi:hypothetical protein